jgi:hypothetical protein
MAMAYSMALSPGFGGSPGQISRVGFSSTPTPQPTALAERRFLSELELANRWGMSPKTLTRWRGMGRGPVFNKFSKKVAYPLDGENGVLDFEKRHVYASTSERVPV